MCAPEPWMGAFMLVKFVMPTRFIAFWCGGVRVVRIVVIEVVIVGALIFTNVQNSAISWSMKMMIICEAKQNIYQRASNESVTILRKSIT